MALSKQPDPRNLSAPNDEFENPLTHHSLTIPSLVKFLTEHPDEKLYVADLRSKTSPAPGDGSLLIGPGKTLQAKLGQNRFAVILNPGRFQLTPESAARLRQLTEEDKQKTAAEDAAMVGVNGFRAIISARVRKAEVPEAAKSPENHAQVEFEKGLIELMQEHHIKAHTVGFHIECDSYAIVQDYLDKARRANFKIVHLGNPNRTTTYSAIIGVEISALLNRALIASKHRGVVTALLRTDEEEVGPYALVFHPGLGNLIILNKEETLRKYRPVRST